MTALPAKYAYLNELVLPRTIAEGLKIFGVLEAPGATDNPVIMAWAKETGIKGYAHDAVPWCGLTAAVIVQRAGKTFPVGPLWALNWVNFGAKVFKAGLGDVLVFKRPGGGHVGFYVGEDHDAYHVLGGNEGDAVSIIRMVKERCVAIRRPLYTNQPESVRAYLVDGTGKLSTNEA